MRANKMLFVALCAGMPGVLPALAQQGGMVVPPPAIQAIDAHLQQIRTREQRETMESKSPASIPPRQTARSSATVKNPASAKSKELPSTIQDLDEQAIFERPGLIDAQGKSQKRSRK